MIFGYSVIFGSPAVTSSGSGEDGCPFCCAHSRCTTLMQDRSGASRCGRRGPLAKPFEYLQSGRKAGMEVKKICNILADVTSTLPLKLSRFGEVGCRYIRGSNGTYSGKRAHVKTLISSLPRECATRRRNLLCKHVTRRARSPLPCSP